MKPRSSLDTVEMVMAFEEAFGTEIEGDSFPAGPSEIVDLLKTNLSNSRPNRAAQALLKEIAKEQHRPELAENLDGLWRREQIAAIVREFFRED